MKLIFKNSGPIDPFIKWLKDFAAMSSSLLIEVDTEEQKFVSKAFTVDKALVRYSEINFADCNLELQEESDKLKERLKLCILLMLPKLITVCETFSTTDFSIEIEFEENQDLGLGAIGELISPSIVFISKSLMMKIDEGSPSAFTHLTDKIFNDGIHKAPDPISVVISPEVIKNIISVSGILTGDPKKDFMIFETQKTSTGGKLFIRDKERHYRYELGEFENGLDGEYKQVTAIIFREKFLLSMKGMAEDTTISISTSDPTRVLLDTVSGKSKTVISIAETDSNEN